MRVPRPCRRLARAAVCLPALLLACELETPPPLVTVYDAELALSAPLPQGWRSEAAEQAGFRMRSFTGPSVDVPDRPGIRVQLMAGPMPAGRSLDDLARRYTEGYRVFAEEPYELHGHEGKTWRFASEDDAERARLMLTPVEGTLYGVYARGEAPTMEAYGPSLDRLWAELSIEKARYFEPFERADFGLRFAHPRSWRETGFVIDPRRSLFVGFRSPPLAVEQDGTTIHATLEVAVNEVDEGTTLETYYAERVDRLGDNYRLLRHEPIGDGVAIADLYHVETQLADYLERTVYYVRGGLSYVFKFNVRNVLYRDIEPWLDEIASTFEPSGRPAS